jgi:hypothetical protein
MIRPLSVLTPDLLVLWLIAGLIYALLHLCLAHRVTRLQSYSIGLGTFLALSLAHAIAADALFESSHLEFALGITTIAAVAGLVTAICWAVRKPQPVESWPGMGPERITNRAMALCESAMIDSGIAREQITDALEMLNRQQYELYHLRNLKAEKNVLSSVQQLRREMALEMAKELEDK